MENINSTEITFLSILNTEMLQNIINREIISNNIECQEITKDYIQQKMSHINDTTDTEDIIVLNTATIQEILSELNIESKEIDNLEETESNQDILNNMSLYMKSNAAPIDYEIDKQMLDPISNPVVQNSLVKNETSFSVYSGDRDIFREHLCKFDIKFNANIDTIGINLFQYYTNVISISTERMLIPKWNFNNYYTGVTEIIISSSNLVTFFGSSSNNKDILQIMVPDGAVPRNNKTLVKYARSSTHNYYLKSPITLTNLSLHCNQQEMDISYNYDDSPDIANIELLNNDTLGIHFVLSGTYINDFNLNDIVSFIDDKEKLFNGLKFPIEIIDESIDSKTIKINVDNTYYYNYPMTCKVINYSMQFYIFFKVVYLDNSPEWQHTTYRLNT